MASFRTFWHGDELPAHVKFCMASFVERGEDYSVYTYRRYDVPRGVKIIDAASILPESSIFYYKNNDGSRGSIAAFADLFRYCLLERVGGWWVDTDVLRLTAPLPRGDFYLGWEDERLICNAIMQTPARHPLIVLARERAEAAGTEKLTWGQSGPQLITAIVRELDLVAQVLPADLAYPIGWRQHLRTVETPAAALTKILVRRAPFLHLWHEVFRRTNDSRLETPEHGSFLYEAYGEIARLAGRGGFRRFIDRARRRVFG